jgi:hypothetical protein
MNISQEIKNALGWSYRSEDFIVGVDNFEDLKISSKNEHDHFYYFYHKDQRRLVKNFVLQEKTGVKYICRVTLIQKEEKFEPRLAFSVRNEDKEIEEFPQSQITNIRANVDLNECHENFWHLISYIRSMKEIEVPQESFSLVSQSEQEIICALRGRDPRSIANIIKQLSYTEGVERELTGADINQLLNRRKVLNEYKEGLEGSKTSESEWQDFFENNKWIFGYGLNYQILRQEQSQPHYGGDKLDRSGGQRGDFLTYSHGNLSFTVLVEIKTPNTPLLQGNEEIRNGAWSLSKQLTDAISQIEANIEMWEQRGSHKDENRDRLESENIFTVKPKGIIVIGTLNELQGERSKHRTFQRFINSIHGIEILTFDQLYQRAKFIVEHNE